VSRSSAAEQLAATAERAETCTNCDLYRRATQTVFGRGPVDAEMMVVGEQPGDKEDLAGEPFVGPAGKLLDRALADAGIEPSTVYRTNVVKHFKWERAGKVRLHKKPSAEQVRACRPWLERELELVDPAIVVLLGATAAQALLGRSFRVTASRGQLVEWELDPLVLATIHPSAVLRAGDRREAMYEGLVDDLQVAATAIAPTVNPRAGGLGTTSHR
jgi:DNA polymerase